jgi:hypothetical protein
MSPVQSALRDLGNLFKGNIYWDDRTTYKWTPLAILNE